MYSPIVNYVPDRTTDYLMCEAYETIAEEGLLEQTLSHEMHTPSGFLAGCLSSLTYIQYHNEKIVYMGWFQPFMSSIVFGMWAHPDFRNTREAVYFFLECLQGAFDSGVDVIVTWAKDRKDDETTQAFIHLQEKFGFTYSGCLEQVAYGKDLHLAVLTRERFDAVNPRIKKLWQAMRQDNG